jgi:hypothetical protein
MATSSCVVVSTACSTSTNGYRVRRSRCNGKCSHEHSTATAATAVLAGARCSTATAATADENHVNSGYTNGRDPCLCAVNDVDFLGL